MVRLFVAGLPPGCTVDDLKSLFSPFGEIVVSGCRLAPPKVYPDGVVFNRDFAHVELLPKDDAALRKCIGAYNGSKWRNSRLRVALARQHYTTRLEAEAAAAAAEGTIQAREGSFGFYLCTNSFISRHVDRIAPPVTPALQADGALTPQLPAGTQLCLRPPKTHACVYVALDSGRKLHLDSHDDTFGSPQQPELPSWEPVEAPPASGYRYEALLQRLAADPPPQLLAAVEERRRRAGALREALWEARQRAEQASVGELCWHRATCSMAGCGHPLRSYKLLEVP
jgi:hypothetical protein